MLDMLVLCIFLIEYAVIYRIFLKYIQVTWPFFRLK